MREATTKFRRMSSQFLYLSTIEREMMGGRGQQKNFIKKFFSINFFLEIFLDPPNMSAHIIIILINLQVMLVNKSRSSQNHAIIVVKLAGISPSSNFL